MRTTSFILSLAAILSVGSTIAAQTYFPWTHDYPLVKPSSRVTTDAAYLPTGSIYQGSGVVCAGTGLEGATTPSVPGEITLVVPAGSVIKQVFLYWEHNSPWPGESHLIKVSNAAQGISGQVIQGKLLGHYKQHSLHYVGTSPHHDYTDSFRADVTNGFLVGTTLKKLITPGVNKIGVQSTGWGGSWTHDNGVGIMVIYDDGCVKSEIQVLEGNDSVGKAWGQFNPDRVSSGPSPSFPGVSTTFTPKSIARTGDLCLYVGNINGMKGARPNLIRVTVGTQVLNFWDKLYKDSALDASFAVISLPIPVPANVGNLKVELLSTLDTTNANHTGKTPETMTWVSAIWSIQTKTICVSQGLTPGYWKNHPRAWPSPYVPKGSSATTLGTAFGITSPSWFPGLADMTMMQALRGGGGNALNGAAKILMRAATAALLNAASSNVSYPMSVLEIKVAVLAALGSNNRDIMLALATKIDNFNNLGL
jgi:hypothetical protein